MCLYWIVWIFEYSYPKGPGSPFLAMISWVCSNLASMLVLFHLNSRFSRESALWIRASEPTNNLQRWYTSCLRQHTRSPKLSRWYLYVFGVSLCAAHECQCELIFDSQVASDICDIFSLAVGQVLGQAWHATTSGLQKVIKSIVKIKIFHKFAPMFTSFSTSWMLH